MATIMQPTFTITVENPGRVRPGEYLSIFVKKSNRYFQCRVLDVCGNKISLENLTITGQDFMDKLADVLYQYHGKRLGILP